MSRDETEQFRKRLRLLRRWNDLTRDELEDRAGLPRGTIGQFESGNRLPSLPNLLKLLKVLGSAKYLLGFEDVPEPVTEAA